MQFFAKDKRFDLRGSEVWKGSNEKRKRRLKDCIQLPNGEK